MLISPPAFLHVTSTVIDRVTFSFHVIVLSEEDSSTLHRAILLGPENVVSEKSEHADLKSRTSHRKRELMT